jgi:hypothetical protein
MPELVDEVGGIVHGGVGNRASFALAPIGDDRLTIRCHLGITPNGLICTPVGANSFA